MRLHRLGQDGTHDESTEGTAETSFLGRQHHAQTQTKGEDDQRLVIQVFLHFTNQRRDNQDTADEPCCQRDGQIDNLAGQFGTFELMADGDAGEQYHQHHSHYILDNQNAGCSLDETFIFHACLVDGLHHNGGARHAEHTGQEQRVDHVKSSIPAHEITHQHHTKNDGQRTYCRYLATADEVLQTELQTDAE